MSMEDWFWGAIFALILLGGSIVLDDKLVRGQAKIDAQQSEIQALLMERRGR